MRRLILAILILLPGIAAQAQGGTIVLREDAFLRAVIEQHPLARRAQLLPQAGNALLRAARGAFDPRIAATYDEKDYAQYDYYEILDLGLQVPTWYGIKAMAGYLHNDGEYLNPEDNTPAPGLASIGLEWTPLRGLMIDKRRAALQKAKLQAQASVAEQNAILNDLLAESTAAYWEWVRAWHAYAIYDSAVTLATIRLDAVRGGWRNGARPAIDTTEAAIQRSARQIDRSAAAYKLEKARLDLETWLWDTQGRPLELGPQVVPPPLEQVPTAPIILPSPQELDSILDAHPQVLAYALKIEQLEVERRMQAEQLKPDLSVKWQWLGTPPGAEASSYYRFGFDNYKLGLALNFPIFLREARGGLENARIQVQATELALADKRRALLNKVQALQAGHDAAIAQANIALDMLRGNEALKVGEDRRFEVGESSLFLVNTREQALIKARIERVAFLTVIPVIRMETFRTLGGAYLLDLQP